jgi:hypothetical protein
MGGIIVCSKLLATGDDVARFEGCTFIEHR